MLIGHFYFDSFFFSPEEIDYWCQRIFFFIQIGNKFFDSLFRNGRSLELFRRLLDPVKSDFHTFLTEMQTLKRSDNVSWKIS